MKTIKSIDSKVNLKSFLSKLEIKSAVGMETITYLDNGVDFVPGMNVVISNTSYMILGTYKVLGVNGYSYATILPNKTPKS